MYYQMSRMDIQLDIKKILVNKFLNIINSLHVQLLIQIYLIFMI